MAKPEKVRICHEPFEGGRFEYIGKLPNGNQFMALVTGAFPDREHYPTDDNWSERKRWLAVVHLFDAEGNHLKSETRLGGFDSEGRSVAGSKAWDQLAVLATEVGLEEAQFCDIYIKLFSVEIDNVFHELIYESGVDEVGGEAYEHVMFWPMDLMFHPPWDSGEYSS